VCWRPAGSTDRDGYRQLLGAGRKWPQRLWAVEGCQGVGWHLAQRLVADGEPVVDVPAKLSRGPGCSPPGKGRKTDATDAHSVAVVALRTPGLRAVDVDGQTVALRLLADRRDELGAAWTLTVNRLQRLLTELVSGGAKTFLSATPAKALLAGVRPRDVVGKTRRRLAAELVVDLDGIDKKIKAANKQLLDLINATGSTLLGLNGIGPSGAARLLGDVGDVSRSRPAGTSPPGTAPPRSTPPPVSRTVTGCRGPGTGGSTGSCTSRRSCSCATTPLAEAYYRRNLAAGKTAMEAIRALKRRLSDLVYRQLVADQKRLRQQAKQTEPGGQAGAATNSSAAGFNPNTDASEKSLPGPATGEITRTSASSPDRSSSRSRRPSTAPTRSRRQAQSA